MANESRSLLCPTPINFGRTYHTSVADANLEKVVTDRRLDTYSTKTTFVLDMTQGGANTFATHLFIKGLNLQTINISGAGVAGSNISQSLSAYEVMDAQGRTTDFQEDGYQNVLFKLTRTGAENWNVSRITVTVTGHNAQVYEIAALNAVVAFDSQRYYRQLAYSRTHRGSRLHQSITGRLKRVGAINNEPPRWRVQMGLKDRWMNQDPIVQKLLNFFRLFDNFAFIGEYSRFPSRVMTEAVLENPDVQLRFLGDLTTQTEALLTILGA